MTTDRRFESDLSDLLAELAPRRTPDYRDDVVRQSARTRQRPAWTFPERWLPVDFTMIPARGGPRILTWVALLAVVGLLVTAMLVTFIGATTRPLPAPFGEATNGALFYALRGQAFRVDAPDAVPRAIVTTDTTTGVLPSRDGTRLLLVHEAGNGTTLDVADDQGKNIRPLDGSYSLFEGVEWSPASDKVAVLSAVDGVGTITEIPADGSAARTVPLGMDVRDFIYLPDGRLVVKGATGTSTDTAFALYVTDPTGANPTVISDVTASETEIVDPHASPDGTRVVYHRWRDPDQKGRIRVIDLANTTDKALEDAAPSEEYSDEGASFSPDGSWTLFTRFLAAGNQLMVVPASGGTPTPIGNVTPDNTMARTTWSPDGSSILAYYEGDRALWQLDPTDPSVRTQLDLPVNDVPTWQRTGG